MSGAERIFDAITNVRSDYVDEAGDYRFVRRHRWTVPAEWRRYAALAACLALIVGGTFALSQVRMGSSGGDGWNGSSGSANGGAVSGDSAGGGWDANTALPPEGAEPGDAAPPPTGPAVGEPPSGEWSYGSGGPVALAQKIPALTAEGAAECVTAARTLTLTFFEDGSVRSEDRYVLSNTGAEGCAMTLRWDGAELVDWSRNMEVLEDDAHRLGIPDGCTAELVLESAAVPADGVLTVEEPQGFAVTESTVSIVNRQWMEERGITVTLGDTAIDP